MKNQSISDFVAASMEAALNSKEHKALFSNQYKYAAATCTKCGKADCKCDSAKADDSFFADDENDARKKKKEDSSDSSSADDMEVSAAFDVAIDSLLTASAALDHVGLDRGSVLTLKIASLVVEAKKEDKKKKKDKKDEKKKSDDKKKPASKSDSQSAKDKKFPFKKKPSSSSSSSKSTPAKKK
jgi:hypothetical protein